MSNDAAPNFDRLRRATTPTALLKILREHPRSTHRRLFELLGRGMSIPTSLRYAVDNTLGVLAAAGLIEIRGHDPSSSPEIAPDAVLSLSPAWQKIQTALGISLSQLAELVPGESLVTRPFLGLPMELPRGEPADLFVLMPFAPALVPVFEDHIKTVGASLGLSVKRADDFFASRAVMREVWAALTASKVVVADCTGRNPNVFYEIGLAHAVGKPVVLVTQDGDDVPFDLRHIRYIEYELTPRGMKEFEAKLGRAIEAALAEER